jgi:hypothetical protein
MKRAYILLGVLISLCSTIWAADIPVAGNPAYRDGALWARKNGTTNTKQDLTSTGSALDVNIASGSTTPPTGASATQVQGTAADGAAAVGSPVQVGGVDTAGNVQRLGVESTGVIMASYRSVGADAQTNSSLGQLYSSSGGTDVLETAGMVFNGTTWDRMRGTTNGVLSQVSVEFAAADGQGSVYGGPTTNNGSSRFLGVYPHLFNGTSMDRIRSAGIGNNVASTGIAAATPYGQYLNNANQPANTTGNYGAAQVDPAGNLRTAPQRPTATDILPNSVSVTATTGTTALTTVPAGRTAVGDVCVSVSGSKAAAATGNGEVLGTVLSAGTNVTPAAGTYFEVDTAIGANAATGTAGTNGSDSNCTKWTQTSPAGNSTTINYVTTCTSTTACRISVSFNGVLQ